MRDHLLIHHLGKGSRKPMQALKQFKCVPCGAWFVSKHSAIVHIATKHEGYDYPKAQMEWKILARNKPELWQQKDHDTLMQEQDELLKEILDDKQLAMLTIKKRFS